MKKLYLDVCTLCRPFDDQNYARIKMETTAYNLILNAIQENQFEIIVSPVHHAEINAIKDKYERIDAQQTLFKFGTVIMKKAIRPRAESLIEQGFGIADAAHLAYAE